MGEGAAVSRYRCDPGPAFRESLRGAPVSSRFQRFLLPGFAFKAVVIGGGYATGRELAEFFLPSGPWGGIAGSMAEIRPPSP